MDNATEKIIDSYTPEQKKTLFLLFDMFRCDCPLCGGKLYHTLRVMKEYDGTLDRDLWRCRQCGKEYE